MCLKIKTGCSGFYNKHWKGIFYPEKLASKDWFTHYAQQLPTLELNNTFYQFPTEARLKTWYNKCPDDFVFSVKAHKSITHSHRFKNCEAQVNDFYDVCEKGLKDKLACVLFQLPPSIQYSDEKLEEILSYMKQGFKNVIEFRHQTWWNKKVYDRLAASDITFVSVNHPKLATDLITNTTTAYVRLHGNPDMFYSNYETEMLKDLHQQIEDSKQLKEAFVYFNNTAGDAGILNAVEFQAMNKNII